MTSERVVQEMLWHEAHLEGLQNGYEESVAEYMTPIIKKEFELCQSKNKDLRGIGMVHGTIVFVGVKDWDPTFHEDMPYYTHKLVRLYGLMLERNIYIEDMGDVG